MLLETSAIPADEDSADLTDAEIEGAVETTDSNHFVQSLEEAIRPNIRPNVAAAVQSYELRKRKPHLYCRARVALDGEPDKVLLFRVDWLQHG